VVLFAAQPLLRKRSPAPFSSVRRKRCRTPFSDPALFLAGAALALLPWLHTRFAIIAVALGGCIALRLLGSAEGRSRLPLFLSVPAISAIAGSRSFA
jgi:hypothetical protein